jgi:hypothetical protein
MATTLSNVNSAMGKATQPVVNESSFTPPENIAMPYKGEQQYVVFKMVKKSRRNSVDGICHNVYNENTKLYETIYLIRGAHSIWKSELTELLKDKDYINKNRLSLYFRDGICRIPVTDKIQLEYARKNINNVGKQRNGSGKRDYYEFDAAEEQKMRADARMQKLKLIQSISSMEEQPMIKLALFLGVKPHDDEVGMPRTPDGFRDELLVFADTKPDIVKKYLGTPNVEVSYLIRKAIMDGKIDLGGESRNVIWAGGGGFIGKVPKERKHLEYLTELALTNSKEGKQFKEQLEAVAT